MKDRYREGDQLVLRETARYLAPPPGAHGVVPERRGEGYRCTTTRRVVVVGVQGAQVLLRGADGSSLRRPADCAGLHRDRMGSWVDRGRRARIALGLAAGRAIRGWRAWRSRRHARAHTPRPGL